MLELVTPLRGVVEKVDVVDTNLSKLAGDLTKSVVMLNNVAETNQEVTVEYVVGVRDSLAGVGITAGPGKTNVPETLLSIATALKDGDGAPEVSVRVHDGQCTFKAVDSQPDRFICTLGCSSELQMGSAGMPSSSSTASQQPPRAPYNPALSSAGMPGSSAPAIQQTHGTTYHPPTPGYTPQQQQFQQSKNSPGYLTIPQFTKSKKTEF